MKKLLFILLSFLIFSCGKLVLPEPTIENPIHVHVIKDNGTDYEPIEGATIIWYYEINSAYVDGDTTVTNDEGIIIVSIPPTATKINIIVRVNQTVGNVNSITSISYTLIPCPLNNLNNPINNNNPWSIQRNNHHFIFGLSDSGWRIFSSVRKI